VEIVDVAAVILVILLTIWLLPRMVGTAKRARSAAVRPAPARVRPTYEWEPVTDRYARRLKRVQRPGEDREAILAFIGGRSGVEAYVEPKTVMHPLSVVFVDAGGEWKRFPLADDAFVRELASGRGIPVFDASRTGYPERMRRHRQPPGATDT